MLDYGIIGYPVGHSLSPEMHEAAFRAVNINAEYHLLETAPHCLAERVRQLKELNYSGWNVTVPYKEAILPFLDAVDGEAAAAGSVNTVLRSNGKLYGYTTDGFGLEEACKDAFSMSFQDASLVFLGTGGAARATAVYAARHGATRILLINRTLERAYALRDTIHAAAPELPVEVLALSAYEEIRGKLMDMDLLFQCTSMGLRAGDPSPLPPSLLPVSLPVMDMVYGETAFLSGARRNGNPVSDGLRMLLFQGVKSFNLWTGIPAPVEVMKKALLAQRKEMK